MNKIITTIVAMMCLLSSTNAQTLNQYKKAAQKAFIEQNYYEALSLYQTVLQVDTQNVEAKYNYAESARNFDAYTIAETSYQQVSMSEDNGNFPLTDYWLASVKKSLGKYDEAIMLYKKYLSSNDSLSNEFTQRANNELQYLDWASTVVNTPNPNITVERLGDHINTPFSEVSPMEVDGNLYYASHRFENEKDVRYPFRPIAKILSSYEGNTGETVDQLNVEKKHTANTTMNKDGSRIYYTICDYGKVADISCQIYFSDKQDDDNWGVAQRLPDYINLMGTTTTQPNITFDKTNNREVMYFVSDREGGQGGLDIWCTVIKENGDISEPVNVESLNTEGDEITPFYHDASNTLYFSSNGRKGLGGYDIYSVKNESENWLDIEHMGYPLNSSYNDLYYNVNNEETKAYFSSNRLGSNYLESDREACCNDIYSVDIEPALIDVQALTFNKNTKSPLNGVDLQFLEMNQTLANDTHSDDNQYDYEGQMNTEYVFIASKIGYQPDTVTINTTGIRSPEKAIGKLYLEPYKLDLTALTFDEKTGLELQAATVKLVKCDDVSVADKTNNNGNIFDFGYINPDDCYKLLVTRDGYEPAQVTVRTDPLTGNLSIEKKISLKPELISPETLLSYLPMPLYFDNDEPDKRTTSTTTSKSYDETVEAYIARRQIFKEKYGKGMSGESRIERDTEIDLFFDGRVIAGSETLGAFKDHLLEFLQAGNKAEIQIQGFASPLAATEYNEKLTSRRIQSIRNYFSRVGGAEIAAYLNSGQLTIVEVPNGESLSEEGISDSYKDRMNSVYSPKASKERRVEIIDIKAKSLQFKK